MKCCERKFRFGYSLSKWYLKVPLIKYFYSQKWLKKLFKKLTQMYILLFFGAWNYVSAPWAEQGLYGSLLCAEQSLYCSLPCAEQQMEGIIADFVLHIQGSNANFAPRIEGSHTHLAQHVERRHSLCNQPLALIAISAKKN